MYVDVYAFYLCMYKYTYINGEYIYKCKTTVYLYMYIFVTIYRVNKFTINDT